ncbi:molybdenum cofactor guanylyltransferase [Sphingomonas sp. UNC305MFCol5.2]|uniref:molybdenum cofactor guanylyltransferase n=1 Tax=Sphingomonas sp. UNC305MFCol5.2 TaxID=1449076 RepID=UPI0005683C9C|nr:molybdenum cofactor guanylyltransferase [Sphingomonas sp. UNC305MFCol5.2]
MRVLGAILAGGKSRRFGTDKALALHEGRCLMGHCIEALREQVDDLVVCGRAWPGLVSLPDRPVADAGPLGGLNAALHYPGFDAVLCVPVDVHPLPGDLRHMLEGGEARVLASQHAIGFWPRRLGSVLDAHLERGHRAIGGWIAHTGAIRLPDAALALVNINTRADLSALAA